MTNLRKRIDFKKITLYCVCVALEFHHWYITLPKKRRKNNVFALFSIVMFYLV